MNTRPATRRQIYHEWRHPERRFRFPALAAALMVLALPAAAQEEPREGQIELTFSVDLVELSKVAGGGDREISVYEANLIVTESVAGPMERMAARCVGLEDFDNKTLAFQGRGSCVWQNAEGDQIFENYEDSGIGAITGTGTLIGGTGKFAGITGGYDFQLEFVASPREGMIQQVGQKKGHWRMVTD
jgi:hypothetical protein